jgi:CubicO group peptidase (beta-lactamase class C family)
MGSRQRIVEAVENMQPIWPAGEANGYHASVIGWICDELLQRWTGKPVHVLLAELFTGPVGAEGFYLGLPTAKYGRMTHMEVDPYVRETQAERARFSDFLNTREGIALPLSWVGGVSDAASLGRLLSILAGRGTLESRTYFSAETQALFSARTNPPGRVDLRLLSEISWGLGFMRGDSVNLYTTGPRPGVIGHAGGGATFAWADPDRNLAVAFLTNKMVRGGTSFDRSSRIGDAVYAALA